MEGERTLCLEEAKCDPMCSAEDNSWQDESGVAHFSEVDRDAMERREDFWKMFSEFVYRHHVVPVNNCVSQKSRPKSVNVHWFREANKNQLG